MKWQARLKKLFERKRGYLKKLLRYFSRISNSVKPKVGWIFEIFCILAISLLGNFPRFGFQTLFEGEYLKIQKAN